MNKYIAFLRGINVGGNNIIKMQDLRDCLEKNGFRDAGTFIQSGNVLFKSNEKHINRLEDRMEDILSKTFNYRSMVLVRSYPQIKKILAEVPDDWIVRHDLRRYIAFLKEPVTAVEALKEVELKPGIDFIKAGAGVVYMTTLLSGITKSGFTKLIGKKIYKYTTIRNYNTTKKIAELMGS